LREDAVDRDAFWMRSGRGTALWWARIFAGLSQQELADAVSAARQTISDIERGAAVPSVSLALAIARRLDRTVEQLFSNDGLRREATFEESAGEELVDAWSVGIARRA
jgi:putative transcriptional regulator